MSAEDSFYYQVRGCMMWSLSTALSIWHKGQRPYLTELEAAESCNLCGLHLVCYQWLSATNLARQRLLYKIRPKGHYFDHLVEQTMGSLQNPMSFANFIDEDQMQNLRSVAMSCHRSTMLTGWCKRYILKKVLLWDRLARGR